MNVKIQRLAQERGATRRAFISPLSNKYTITEATFVWISSLDHVNTTITMLRTFQSECLIAFSRIKKHIYVHELCKEILLSLGQGLVNSLNTFIVHTFILFWSYLISRHFYCIQFLARVCADHQTNLIISQR